MPTQTAMPSRTGRRQGAMPVSHALSLNLIQLTRRFSLRLHDYKVD